MFYHSEDGDVEDILESMETLDDNMDAEEVEFVRCSDPEAVSYYGLTVVPSLVYFEVPPAIKLSKCLGVYTLTSFGVQWCYAQSVECLSKAPVWCNSTWARITPQDQVVGKNRSSATCCRKKSAVWE